MELVSKAMCPMVNERQEAPRYHLLTRVDISVAGGHETYWGSLVNLSRTGVTLRMRQLLQPSQKITIRFSFQSEDGKARNEALTAKFAWRSGDNAGLQFETPLTTDSPALQRVPHLAASLSTQETEGRQR